MELENKLKKAALGTAFDYIARAPERNVHKLMGWVDKFAGDDPNELTAQRDAVRKVLSEPDSNMYKYIMGIFRDIDTEVLKKTFENFIVNANLVGFPREQELSAEYGCNVPWAILMDPTTACNLRCVGCWAADYGKSLSMSYEELSDIVRQGKELGIYMYLFSGGEPLTRKKDIIRLCEEHNDCQFLAFTNGTLIDSDFAREMLRVKNFIPAISVEGFEAATDARRGEGTYKAVMAAMSRLKAYKLPFGVSCCYTSQNIDSLSSEEFIDHIIGCGAKFAWFFHYMPVGVDAVPELLPSPEQREHMYHTLRGYRKTKELFLIDFQNDGEFVGGCIAGGRSYLHISAGGDMEPCAFIHYSDSNIREKTLLEALQSPLFMAYHDNQPFNCNHLRPCPMLENPERLAAMVKNSGAHSTDMQSPEDAEKLREKCKPYAEAWAPTADKLWKESHE
jgi:MoaA/NifB/PqqE/SkfB family radical SAM enzyme